jgi:hypothetical protein
MIATDTNYSFTLDGAQLMRNYDPKKGFVLSFTMPDHDVKLHCFSCNSMPIEMPEEE